jgi:hypothetical protein
MKQFEMHPAISEWSQPRLTQVIRLTLGEARIDWWTRAVGLQFSRLA